VKKLQRETQYGGFSVVARKPSYFVMTLEQQWRSFHRQRHWLVLIMTPQTQRHKSGRNDAGDRVMELMRRCCQSLASQLWGTGARAPSTSDCVIFLGTSEPHKLWHSTPYRISFSSCPLAPNPGDATSVTPPGRLCWVVQKVSYSREKLIVVWINCTRNRFLASSIINYKCFLYLII